VLTRLLICLKPYVKKVIIKPPRKVGKKEFGYYIVKLGYKYYWLSIKPFKIFLLGEMEVNS